MPLLMTKIHVLNKTVKKERRSKDASKDASKSEAGVTPPTYVIDTTNEICENEDEYNRKTMLYKEKVWTCRCTGKLNLTYKDAMKSEQSSLKTLKKFFPKCFEKPVLELVQHTVDCLDNIVHKAYTLIHQEFCINEPISLKVNQPGKTVIEGLIVKVDRSTDEKKNSTVTTNGTTSSPSESSDKENSSVKKSPTGPPPKKEYFYSIKLLDQDKIVSRVPASAVNRDVKPPSKEHIRLFIRAHSIRYGHNVTGPWIVDDDYVKRCKLTSKNKSFEIDKVRLKAYSNQQEIEQINRIKSKAAGGSGSASKKPRILYLKDEILKEKLNHHNMSDDEDEDVPLMQIKKKQAMFATPIASNKKMKQATLFDLSSKSGKANNSSFKPNFTPSRSVPPIATRLIKLIRENKPDSVISQITTRCAQFLNDSQINVLPIEIRDRVKERKTKLEEKKTLDAMTPEQREEFMKKKRQETIEKQREKKRLQNRRFEDTDLENEPLPAARPLNLAYSDGLSSEQLAQIISLAEMLRCFKGLLIPVEAEKSWREWDGTLDHYRSVYGQIIVRAERLCWALTCGKEGSIYLGHLLTVMLQTLLQDDSMSRRRELNSKLSDIPVTPYTVSEMLRLVLRPPVKKSAPEKRNKRKFQSLTDNDDRLSVKKEENDDGAIKENGECSAENGKESSSEDGESEEEEELDPYAMEDSDEMEHLCDRLSQVEFHDLTLNEKLSLLRGMQQRILDLEMLDEHIDECQRKLSEAYKKKISELKKRNDKIREEKAKKKEENSQQQPNDKDKIHKSKKSKKNKKDKTEGTDSTTVTENASDDLASVVKRRRVLAAQAHRERELKEETERKRRQIEAQELAGERLLLAVNKELEESTVEVKNVFRMSALGSDRYHNRYWLFPSAPPGVYVEKNWAPNYCSYSVNPRNIKNYSASKLSEVDLNDGADMVETTLPPCGKPLFWEMYNSVEELDELVKHLNPLGVRESKLKQELKATIEEEKARIKAQQNLILKQNSSETHEKEKQESVVEDPLITGFKIELSDSYNRLINGGLSITESNQPWIDRMQIASTREELARCLIEVQESVYERFLCGPFTPKKDTSAGPDSTEIIESPWIAEWKAAVLSAPTQSRLNMLQGYLDSCIKWEKSIADAKCRICRRKNEAILILCDSCNQAFHMYCLRPPVLEPPNGDWFCPACKPIDKRRAKQDSDCGRKRYIEDSDSGDNDPECLVCDAGEEQELVRCSGCPNSFHFQCHEPPLRHKPRGDWYCSDCRLGTKLRKRLKGNKAKSTRKKSSRSFNARPKKYDELSSDDEKTRGSNRNTTKKTNTKRPSRVSSKPAKIQSSHEGSSDEESDNNEESDSNKKSHAASKTRPKRNSKKRKVESEEEDDDEEEEEEDEESQPRRRSQRQKTSISFKFRIEESSDEDQEEEEETNARKSRSSKASRGSTSSACKYKRVKRPLNVSSDEENDDAPSESNSRPSKKRARLSKPTVRSVNEQLNIANNLLDSLWKHRSAWPFIEPVDLEEVPDYLEFISHPIDLSTMKEKMRQEMYNSLGDVISDIHQMFRNVELYNEPQSDVFQTSKKLEQFFNSQMEKLAPDVEFIRHSS